MGLSYYVSGPIVDEMVESWGDGLEGLNLSEKLWLVRCFLGSAIDWDTASQHGLDENVAEAEEALIEAPEGFKIKVVYGFCKYLSDEPQPLSYYLSDRNYSDWINSAMETWGNRLERFPENSGLILLFNLATEPIDFNNLPNLDGLHECLNELEKQDEETQGKLISAIAELAYNQYLAEAK